MYNRIHLDDMATPTAYEKWGEGHGLEKLDFTNIMENIAIHYGSVSISPPTNNF